MYNVGIILCGVGFVILWLFVNAGFFYTFKRVVIGVCCLCIILVVFQQCYCFITRDNLIRDGAFVVKETNGDLAVDFPTIASWYPSEVYREQVKKVVKKQKAGSFDKVRFEGLEKFGKDWPKHLKDTVQLKRDTGVRVVTGGAISVVNYRRGDGRFLRYGFLFNDVVFSMNSRAFVNEDYVYYVEYDKSSWDYIYDFDKKYREYRKCIVSCESLEDYQNGRSCWKIASRRLGAW